MLDFEVLVDAYRQRHGAPAEDIESTDDLDGLYAALGKRIEENPEAWR